MDFKEKEGPFKYLYNSFIGIAIGLSQLLIGAVLVAILLYSTNTELKDKHILFATFGFFFSVEAILTTNVRSGWAAQLEVRHRYYAHAAVQICAILCTVMAAVNASIDYGSPETPHSISGVMVTALFIVQAVTGALALFLKWPNQIIHILVGLITFVTSSFCAITGIYKSVLDKWFGNTAILVLMGFVAFYTFFIAFLSILKLILRIRHKYDEEDEDDEQDEE